MKIIRMKKENNGKRLKTDMLVVLCLVQLLLIVIIALAVFMVSKADSDAFGGILRDIEMIFDDDIDIGGYFTPSEEKTEKLLPENAGFIVYSDYEKETDEAEKETDQAKKEGLSSTSNEAFDNYSSAAVFPVLGTITSDYGYREHPVYSGESFHKGRDIAAEEGSDIYAVLDGEVIETGNAEMAGNYIKIAHENGLETFYCHCKEIYLKEGVYVRKGDVIASVGQTGLATGPHLHFELHENNVAVDPEKILCEAQNVY